MSADTLEFLAGVEVKPGSISLWNLVMADIRAKAHLAHEKVVPLRDMPPVEWELV